MIGGFGAGVLGASVVQLGLDARGLERGIADSRREVQRGTSAMEGSAGKLRAAWVGFGALAGAAILKFGADSVKAFAESERASLKLQNTLANNAKLSDVSTASWNEQAQAMMNLVGVSDEAVTSAQALLGAFGLTGKQVQELIPLVVDLSEKYEIDLESAAKAVGKAVGGSGGILSRYGVILDAAALKADGFGTVMAGLEDRVGGFSKSISQTAEVRLKVFGQRVDNAREAIGAGLIPIMEQLIDVAEFLLPALEGVGKNFDLIFKVLLGYAALGFLPGLLAKIAMGLQTAGAAGLASRITGTAMSMKLLGGSIFTTIPQIFAFTQGFQFLVDLVGGKGVGQATANRINDVAGLGRAFLGAGKGGSVLASVLQQSGPIMDMVRAKAREGGSAFDQYADATQRSADAANSLYQAHLQLTNSFLGIQGAFLNAKQATVQLGEAEARLAELAAAGQKGTAEWTDAQNGLTQAQTSAMQSQIALDAAASSYRESLEAEGSTQAEVNDKIREFGARAGLTRAEVEKLIGRVVGLTNTYGQVPGSVHTEITVNTVAAQGLIDTFVARNAGRMIPISVATGGMVQHGGMLPAQHGFEGIVRKPTMFMVAERGHPERVSVSPATGGLSSMAGGRNAGDRAGGVVNIIFQGPVYGLDDFDRRIDEAQGRLLAALNH